jgi:hypothetical protein
MHEVGTQISEAKKRITGVTTGWVVVLALSALISAIWVLNPAGIQTPFGTASGRYIDVADSFSDYLVQNKIRNDMLGFENKGSFLIVTKGYSDGDYDYYPDGSRQYYSAAALQARMLSWFAGIMGSNSSARLDRFINGARVSFAFLAALSLVLFFHRALGPADLKDYVSLVYCSHAPQV